MGSIVEAEIKVAPAENANLVQSRYTLGLVLYVHVSCMPGENYLAWAIQIVDIVYILGTSF